MPIRTDYLLNERVKITQSAEGYCAGLDAVMLAAACPAQAGDNVLDLGCGAGAASLCLAARVENLKMTGIEIQHDQAALARTNFAANFTLPLREGQNCAAILGRGQSPSPQSANLDAAHLAKHFDPLPRGERENFEIICADLTEYKFTPDSFDHVIMNPPYHDAAQHMPPENAARATAFMAEDLSAWIAAGRRAVKTHGGLTIIHRADAIGEILQNLTGFGAIEIIPLWPHENAAAERVIIRARKGRKTPPAIWPGIIIHTRDGSETEAARSILRDGAKIP